MSDPIEVTEAPSRPSKAALLKAYLDELNIDLHVQQLFEDGKFIGQSLRVAERQPKVETE